MAEIIGEDELRDKLEELISNMNWTEPLEQACFLVENRAKQNLTDNNTVDSGELRNSITHRIEGNVGIVGTNILYAPYVEFGTGIYAANGDGRKTPWVYYTPRGYQYTNPKTGVTSTEHWVTTVGQKPQPFLHPALDMSKMEIDLIFQNYIEQELGE